MRAAFIRFTLLLIRYSTDVEVPGKSGRYAANRSRTHPSWPETWPFARDHSGLANLALIDEGTANREPTKLTDALSARTLLPKRIGQLPADLGRYRCVVHAVGIREHVFRHPERPKKDIPDRKRSGKVGIAAPFQRGVVPAVEHRRRQHVFERTKRPVEIGVNERRMERRERSDPEHDVG